MKSKALTILLTLVLSIPFFISMAVLFAWLGGLVLGTSVASDGKEYIKHGQVVPLIALILTVVFAIWFYKFMMKYKSSKASE